jgi:hypothetical protein
MMMEVRQRFDTPCRRKELKAGPRANPTGGARPNLMTAAGIMALHRRVGNHAVASMVGKNADGGASPGKASPPPSPSPAPAAPAVKTVTLRVTYLKGGSTDLATHLAKANEVFKQASVKVAGGTEQTLDEARSKAILGDDLILDEFTDPKSPTAEETALLKENRAAGSITMYYVKAMSHGSVGEAFTPSTGSPVGFVYASPRARTFPHELGHILLDDGAHPADADNFMAQTAVATGKELMTADQIKTIRASSFVK